MTPKNLAVVAIVKRLPRSVGVTPYRYLGIAEISGFGFREVEVALPFGVRDFPYFPYMVTVDGDTTFIEFRRGKTPLLQVTEWKALDEWYFVPVEDYDE